MSLLENNSFEANLGGDFMSFLENQCQGCQNFEYFSEFWGYVP